MNPALELTLLPDPLEVEGSLPPFPQEPHPALSIGLDFRLLNLNLLDHKPRVENSGYAPGSGASCT